MDRERIGKYKIVGELGRGTMGEVYKAHDPVLNRFVALKTLAVKLGPDDETQQRFQREAQAAALLNHPNIVTVHDFGEEQGLLYMAMELLEGIDLREAIDRELLGSLDEKLNVDGAACSPGSPTRTRRASSTATSSPPTSTCGTSRQVKIMDFGLARAQHLRDDPGRASCSARRTTCRPSRRSATRWTAAPTSSRPAPCSTSC